MNKIKKCIRQNLPSIDLERYPRIRQVHPLGCIPINIANTLKYFDVFNYDERTIFMFYQDNHLPFCFDQALPYLERLLPNFELIFKGRSDFEDSMDNMIEYLKENIDNQIPVLVSFEASGGAHIRTLIEYSESEFVFFDPGDCQLKRFNYQTNEFSNALRGDHHTLVIKLR